MNNERELTIDELNAVSGGSLPLPAIVATILRGPTTNPPGTISPGLGGIRGESTDAQYPNGIERY
jgi:bacteriocin-like protein